MWDSLHDRVFLLLLHWLDYLEVGNPVLCNGLFEVYKLGDLEPLLLARLVIILEIHFSQILERLTSFNFLRNWIKASLSSLPSVI